MQLLQEKHRGKVIDIPYPKATILPVTPRGEIPTWEEAQSGDAEYMEIQKLIQEGARKFLPRLLLKVSMSECNVDAQDNLLFRGWRWVPHNKPLHTSLIQTAHDSALTGHPGQEQTYLVVSRTYFWLNISKDIH
jgi:hypothetical protein